MLIIALLKNKNIRTQNNKMIKKEMIKKKGTVSMNYLYIKEDDGRFTSGELITIAECARLHIRHNMKYVIEVNKNHTYTNFGVRMIREEYKDRYKNLIENL